MTSSAFLDSFKFFLEKRISIKSKIEKKLVKKSRQELLYSMNFQKNTMNK